MSVVRCSDLACPQGAGTETSRINDETPTSHHEHLMGRQDNQHRSLSAGSSWSTINGDHPNTDEPEVARSCWENGSPASPQAATLLTVMRGQIQSEYTKAEIQRHCKKKPEEVGYRKEFVAADGQRRTELRRGILNETVIVASDRQSTVCLFLQNRRLVLTSIGEIGGIFSQINGIVKVENIKRSWVKLLTYFLKLQPYSMGEKGRRG